MSRGIDRVPDVVACRHPFVGNGDHPTKVKLFFDAPEVWPVGQTVIGISGKEFISNGDSPVIHEKPHLYDRVWPMLFGNAFVKEVVLLLCLEIVVCNIIIDQAGIPAIILFDMVI